MRELNFAKKFFGLPSWFIHRSLIAHPYYWRSKMDMLTIRLPKRLKEELDNRADEEGISTASYSRYILRRAVDSNIEEKLNNIEQNCKNIEKLMLKIINRDN